MAEEIRLVGSFRDNITPQLKKLNREINNVTKAFDRFGKKLRPISKEMGRLAMSSQRVADSMKQQRQSLNATTQAMRAYTTASRKAAAQQRKMKPSRAPRAPRGGGGGGGMVGGRGGGIGFTGMVGAGLMTNAVIAGFRMGADAIQAPFKAFGAAFAERMGDEMADIQSAGGMFALDEKAGGNLFGGDFGKARAMQERLNASLARSAAALPGATNDYVKAARGITDTVMGAFSKNEEAFKSFATELGAREGATSEEAITKVMSRFTEQTVLLGMGGSKGGMPLTMLMEQLVTQEGVNIQGMKRRYAQLRQNPLLATMLEDAEEEINAAGAGTAERMKAVMAALDRALPQQVVNAMRRSMDGLVEATRSAFFDPDTGLFGLSRKITFMVGDEEVTSSLFEAMRNIAANIAVPLMELLNFLPQIFDPFANLMPTLHKFQKSTEVFFKRFEGMANFFEDEATKFLEMSKNATDPKVQKQLRRQANMLKEQSGSRGALAAINEYLKGMGILTEGQFKSNLEKLMDFSPEGLEFDFSEMAVNMLKQFAASPMVKELVGTVGEVLGLAISGFAEAIGAMLDGTKGGGFNIFDTFMEGLNKGIGDTDVQGILSELLGRMIDSATAFIVNKGLPMLFAATLRVLKATWDSSIGGKLIAIALSLLLFQKAVMVTTAVMSAFGTLKTVLMAAPAVIAGWLGAVGPATTAVMAFGAKMLAAATSVATFLAPILAVVGAVLGLVAVFRHLDYIIDSVAAGFELFRATMDLIAAKMLQGIGFALQKISFGTVGKGLEESGKNLAAEAAERQTAAMQRIADNTKASLARTSQDFTQIGNMLGLKSDAELAEAQKIATAANDTAVATRQAGADIVSAVSRIKVTAPAVPNVPATATPKYNGRGRSMSLGAAISTEMANKPSGSSLVIANSSEQVIPAYKGYTPNGMSGGGATTINFNPTINAGNMDADELANLMAAKVMEAVQEATYAEVYTS